MGSGPTVYLVNSFISDGLSIWTNRLDHWEPWQDLEPSQPSSVNSSWHNTISTVAYFATNDNAVCKK